MHSFDSVPIKRALTRNVGRLVRRARSNVASLQPGTVDAIIIGIFGAILAVAEYFNDLAPKLFQFAMDHGDWEIDNLIFVIFVASIGMVIFSYRRVRELAVEMKARRNAELEAK